MATDEDEGILLDKNAYLPCRLAHILNLNKLLSKKPHALPLRSGVPAGWENGKERRAKIIGQRIHSVLAGLPVDEAMRNPYGCIKLDTPCAII